MDYFFSRNFNGYTYTIDMFRLKSYVTDYEIFNTLNELEFQGAKFWRSNGFGKFHYNYKIDAMWIGLNIGNNTEDKKDGNLFCIEFNPNKATERDWFWFYFFINKYDFHISRFDLAIDIPKNINNLVFINNKKRTHTIIFNDYNNKTYYFGKGDGHTKIYNKKIESCLDYELTRYEVTKEVDFSYKTCSFTLLDFHFLDIFFTPYLSTSSDDPTLNAILFAVNSGFPFKSLSRSYKSLISKDLLGTYDLSNEFGSATFFDFVNFLKSKSGISNKPD